MNEYFELRSSVKCSVDYLDNIYRSRLNITALPMIIFSIFPDTRSAGTWEKVVVRDYPLSGYRGLKGLTLIFDLEFNIVEHFLQSLRPIRPPLLYVSLFLVHCN